MLWGLITHGTAAGTGDEPHYMMIARSLTAGGDLDLADDYGDASGVIHEGRLDSGAHVGQGRGGATRPVHDLGMPALFAPWFAVSYWIAEHAGATVSSGWMRRARLNRWLVLRHLLSFGMIAATVALVARLFDAFVERSGDVRLSFVAALLAGLSPPLLTHSYLFFSEILSALVALTAFRMIAAADERTAWHFRFGLLTGFLLLVHVRNAGLVLGLCAVAAAAWRTRPRTTLAWALAGLAIPVALRTAVNQVFWGTWIGTPHVRADWSMGPVEATGAAISRLGGLLLDQEHGLLLYAPVYLLVPLGLVAMRAGRGAVAPMVVVAAYLVPVVCPWLNVHGWRGGWSPAARMLVPIVPFLAIIAFEAIVAGNRRIAAGLAVVQLVVVQLLWRRPRLAWNEGDGTAEFAEALFAGAASWLPAWTEGGGIALTVGFLCAWAAVAAVIQMRPALRAARPAK